MFFSKKSPHTPGCMAVNLVAATLLFLTSLAALIGVYVAHVQDDELTFGSMSGSLSLIALAVCLTLWLHQMKNCMMKCEICK
ncbi:MAG: hypothetical protein Greene041619_9 [Candidatus Peregrinibacteria bacterium Greene0416_19]|nr:MAG: hypothetical protein Greene041619_9 [Candidatus Peregrinibacteria bacterium Greene0416_19]